MAVNGLNGEKFYAYKISAGLSRTVEIARISEFALVEIFLEGAGDVFHAGRQLHAELSGKRNCIRGFYTKFEKRRTMIENISVRVRIRIVFGHIFRSGSKMRHIHPAGVDSGK